MYSLFLRFKNILVISKYYTHNEIYTQQNTYATMHWIIFL